MRLKIQLFPSTRSEAITGVDWLNADEALHSDDRGVCCWSTAKMESTPLTIQTGKDAIAFPTSLQLAGRTTFDAGRQQNAPFRASQKQRPAVNSPISAGSSELLLLTSSDGKIHLVTLAGKLEKSVEAHQGAAILARWSRAEPGGAGGFVSCGEDGSVKMWSRGGMLRSVLAQLGKPIYALDWNGDSTKLAYCCGEECFIKLLNAQTQPIKWHAHGGIVLCIAWSASNDQIVTGGEDCRYRLWDGQGRPLWSSLSHGHPVCSVAWNPGGYMFAVGSFNLLRLCDQSGWSHSLERPASGSLYALSWSPDGTQLLAGCANGHLLHAQIVEKRLCWEQLEAVHSRRKTINIRDLSSEVARERLETRDRVVRLELGFNFLVVATTKQCYIFSAKNWNTPVVVDLKDGAGIVALLRLCQKCFLLADSSAAVQVWNYDGIVLSTIRLPSSGANIGEPFNERTAAIANDLVVLRDRALPSTIHLFDPISGKPMGDGEIVHTANIVELCVNQCGPIAERRVAFVDTSGDCFLARVNCYGAAQRTVKIGALISSLVPNNATNMLTALQEGHRLLVWTLPTVAFLDRDLLQSTQLELGNGSDLGKSCAIIGFVNNTVTVRRSDGCLMTHYVPPFIGALMASAQRSQWDQAVRICRAIKEDLLWATLAGLAVAERNFTVAEVCYGQLREAEKVLFLSELRAEPNPQQRAVQMAQFGGNAREAETALVKSGRFFRAILLNLGIFRFDRALDLALKSGTHLDTVLGYRQRYLELLGRKENEPKFLKHLAQVEVDWPHIFEKIREEEQKEQRQQQWDGPAAGRLGSPN